MACHWMQKITRINIHNTMFDCMMSDRYCLTQVVQHLRAYCLTCFLSWALLGCLEQGWLRKKLMKLKTFSCKGFVMIQQNTKNCREVDALFTVDWQQYEANLDKITLSPWPLSLWFIPISDWHFNLKFSSDFIGGIVSHWYGLLLGKSCTCRMQPASCRTSVDMILYLVSNPIWLGVVKVFLGTETNYFCIFTTWQVANQNSLKIQNFEHPHLFQKTCLNKCNTATWAGIVCTPDIL